MFLLIILIRYAKNVVRKCHFGYMIQTDRPRLYNQSFLIHRYNTIKLVIRLSARALFSTKSIMTFDNMKGLLINH